MHTHLSSDTYCERPALKQQCHLYTGLSVASMTWVGMLTVYKQRLPLIDSVCAAAQHLVHSVCIRM